MTTDQMIDILDTTFKTLYNNMDKNGLHFEKQILWPNKIKVKPKESEMIWNILMSTGLAGSMVGFGNEGKLEINTAGIQMMTRFGSYKNFLATQQGAAHPLQSLTIQLANPEVKDSQLQTKPLADPSQPEVHPSKRIPPSKPVPSPKKSAGREKR